MSNKLIGAFKACKDFAFAKTKKSRVSKMPEH